MIFQHNPFLFLEIKYIYFLTVRQSHGIDPELYPYMDIKNIDKKCLFLRDLFILSYLLQKYMFLLLVIVLNIELLTSIKIEQRALHLMYAVFFYQQSPTGNKK